ncbi:MAG: hypothetical protein P8J37_09210 [Fuerstiella sp.]|nr:hypothetical protein [Fuerstiella sp.]
MLSIICDRGQSVVSKPLKTSTAFKRVNEYRLENQVKIHLLALRAGIETGGNQKRHCAD